MFGELKSCDPRSQATKTPTLVGYRDRAVLVSGLPKKVLSDSV